MNNQEEPDFNIPENVRSKRIPNSKKDKRKIHPIYRKLTFWCLDQGKHEDYDKCVHKISDFTTVEEFWRVYCHLKKSKEIPAGNEFHVFVDGVKPLWEDVKNKYGGKWVIRVKKEYGQPLWEKLVLCFLGGNFNVAQEEVLGIVYGVRKEFHSINVWNSKWENHDAKDRIKDILIKTLELPIGTSMEYRAHNKHHVEHVERKKGKNEKDYEKRGVKRGGPGVEFYTVRRTDKEGIAPLDASSSSEKNSPEGKKNQSKVNFENKNENINNNKDKDLPEDSYREDRKKK